MRNHKLVLPEHLNHYGYLFGGYLLHWVDEYGYIAANLDFPGHRFVTIALDNVAFKKSPKIDIDFWGNLQVGCQTRQRTIFETSRMFTDTVRNKNWPITKYGSQIAGL